MSEKLVDMIVVLEDAAQIRQDRLNGDPDREPDETTEEDVIEAMIRDGASPLEIIDLKNRYTRALRLMLRAER